MKLSPTTGALVCLIAALGVQPVGAQESEKVLFGFEREEVEKAVQAARRPNEFKPLENGDFLFYLTRTPGASHDHEISALRPMRCVQEQASQGKYACKISAPLDAAWSERPSFALPRAAAYPLHYATPQANLRRPEIFNPSGWFDWVFPRDWSGYDLLRVDLRLDTPGTLKLMLEVEDSFVEPPVSLTYQAPETGKWVTLEMDLAQAAADRKLDLKCIENLWVRLELKEMDKLAREWEELLKSRKKNQAEMDKKRFVAYVDNIRLCGKDAPAAFPVLKGTRSEYTKTLPRSYAAEEFVTKEMAPMFDYSSKVVPADTKMPPAAKAEPVAGPMKLAPPSTIPIKEMIEAGSIDKRSPGNYNSVRLTCAAAVDPKHLTVGFYIIEMGSLKSNATADRSAGRSCGAVVGTTDGGKTWKGLDGTAYPTVLGGNSSKSPPRPRDLGADVMGMYVFGCGGITGAHVGNATDKVFFVRSVFTGEGWWKSPKYFMSGDPRHCHRVPLGDLVATPSGRIWAAWSTRNRRSYGHLVPSYSTSAYYSDDGGATWCGWRGPGFNGEIPCGGKGVVGAAPYRGQLAVFGPKDWTWFDGKKWSEPEKTGINCWYVISLGEEIYLSDGTGPVKWYDGKAWQPFAAPGRTGKGGKIGVCGWKTAVFVEPDAEGKKLLCWRKTAGGEWRGPQQLAAEEAPITQFVVERYGPAEFAPVAYMCGKPTDRKQKPASGPGFEPSDDSKCFSHEPWIKVLLVPAQGIEQAEAPLRSAGLVDGGGVPGGFEG